MLKNLSEWEQFVVIRNLQLFHLSRNQFGWIPEETNASYGLSKKMMIVQSQSYKQQYDFNSISIIPTNFYGPEDDFDPKISHVIPALILKVHEAMKNNLTK